MTFTDEDGDRLIDGANLVLAPGSTTAVVGSTGRDQAALLALLLGLNRPERGRILIDGRDVTRLPLQVSRSTMALVLRNPWIREGSIADNIGFGHPGVTRDDIRAVGSLVGLDDLIDGLAAGYDTTIITPNGRTVLRLQNGQKRQIALARALVRDPAVLLFEEPTSGLGTDDERRMLQAIAAAARDRTTLIATHRMSLARRADAVVVIEDGKILPYQSDAATSDHNALWDLQVPPVRNPRPAAGRSHLRLVKRDQPPTPRPSTSAWGITIGSELAPGYLASGLLGRGTLTETWVAWSIEREEPVRIKVPKQDPVTYPAFDQLFREYRTLKRCNHPGLVATYGADLDAEMPHAIFEYLDSNSLAKVAQRRGEGMDALDILYAGFELAGAINYLHQRGLVHLGLRASAVRTREDTIVITDLTTALPIGTSLPGQTTAARIRRNESRSLAPEFLPGRAADPKMDVYALGALMHRATAGSVVTATEQGGSALAPYRSIAANAPGAMPDIIDAMLSPDPAERPDAEQVLSEFRRIIPSSLVRPRVSTAAARSPRLRLVGVNN
ncbi:MAG: protein kinase [Actinomycetota bacterium]